jgi:hypothetical protein
MSNAQQDGYRAVLPTHDLNLNQQPQPCLARLIALQTHIAANVGLPTIKLLDATRELASIATQAPDSTAVDAVSSDPRLAGVQAIINDRIAYDSYFEMQRRELTHHDAFLFFVKSSLASLMLLPHVNLDHGDIDAFLLATMNGAALLGTAVEPDSAVAADSLLKSLEATLLLDPLEQLDETLRRTALESINSGYGGTFERQVAPLAIWRRAHHQYGWFNQIAATLINRAVTEYCAGDLAKAAETLLAAVDFVRGFTAMMLLAEAMPSATYKSVVRPTMEATETRVAISGHANTDHRLFRTAMASFIKVIGGTFQAVANESFELAIARELLLAADLSDIERHIHAAEKLIGIGASLGQNTSFDLNAIEELRAMAAERNARYRPMRRGWTDTIHGEAA